MIVKIDKKEREVIEQVCALSNCKVTFYSIEPNPLMIQAEITENNGDELSAKDAWLIGRSVVWSITCNEIKNL